jgi:hypothetical protein
MIQVPFGTQRFLAAFEGFEGGFAIGASIVVALSFTNLSLEILLATAIITIIVNGFNNSSVKYSSEHYLDELDGREKRNAFRSYFIPSLIEFVSYFAISFISIIPLMVLRDKSTAITLSVIITLTILYAAGYWRAYMLQMPRHRDAVETVILGGGIILVGLVSGYCLHLLQIG